MARITAGIAECRVSADPQDVLVALGLGSCVGVALFDPHASVAGLLHVMLPERPAAVEGPAARRAATTQDDPLTKYADSGVPELVAAVTRLGAVPWRLKAAIGGGAMMFKSVSSAGMNIGLRNAEAVAAVLQQMRIPLVATATGGTAGRTMSLYVDTGRVTVREAGGTETEIAVLSSVARAVTA